MYVQEECERPLLREERLRRVDGGVLQRLTIWAAIFDPDGVVHQACCRELCLHLKEARTSGTLEAVAREEQCTAPVVSGMYLFLDELVKQAMETGALCHVAGISVYPTGL
jgi:hypothetical protein